VRTLVLYVLVGVAYVSIGVLVPDFLYSSVVGAAFLLIGVWVLPEALRRLKEALGSST
jgi:hypothetical protein